MEVVGVARRGRVLEVTLDRPKVNAIDAATSIALGEAFHQLQTDDDLSVGIITAAGDRFFSAGWDLKAASAGEPADADQGVGGFAGLTEYWDLFPRANGEQWIVITTTVHDPANLQTDWITSLNFKKEASGTKWDPTACSTTW